LTESSGIASQPSLLTDGWPSTSPAPPLTLTLSVSAGTSCCSLSPVSVTNCAIVGGVATGWYWSVDTSKSETS
jgi:hypothetical protein